MKGFKRLALLGTLVFVAPLGVYGQRGGGEPPQNLKVLPADMDSRAVRDVMQRFTDALDVGCSHCHASDKENARRLDFASDEKETKEVTREMMRMVQDINKTYLPKTGRTSPIQVTCETCHHGSPVPKTLGGELSAVFEKEGIDATLEKYKHLRDLYYGRAVFDFGENSLVDFAGSLKDADAALRVCQLNLDYFPKSVSTFSQMSRIYRDKGDNAAALQILEKALALEPENRFLQRQISRLKEGN